MLILHLKACFPELAESLLQSAKQRGVLSSAWDTLVMLWRQSVAFHVFKTSEAESTHTPLNSIVDHELLDKTVNLVGKQRILQNLIQHPCLQKYVRLDSRRHVIKNFSW